MEQLGIHTGADLRDRDLAFLAQHFGSSAAYLHGAARGIDLRAVRADRPLKSVGAENTFGSNLMDAEAVRTGLDSVLESFGRRLARAGVTGRTVTLKVKYADFRQVTRSRSQAPTGSLADIAAIAHALAAGLAADAQGIRLLGVTLSGLVGEEEEEAGQPGLPL